MSVAKLNALGIDLPLFPTTSVGSFPKPAYLQEARTKYARGKISARDLRQVEEEATRFWMATQEELGIDVLVDGEMYRGDMVAYFAEQMDGFDRGGLVRSYGNRYYFKPIVTGEIRWRGPMTVAWWKFAQGLTKKPVKGMLTGPYTIMDWSFNEYYPDRRAVVMAVARELRKEVEALIAAGARIIQIDEPAVSVRPEELPVAIEGMRAVVEGLDAYFVTHICYGAFEKIYPEMLDIPVDNFDLEMTNSGLELLDLFARHRFTKDISFGVLDVHTHTVEDEAGILAAVRRGLEVLPAEAVWVDPDCGLKTRSVEESVDKLRAMARAVEALRASHGGGRKGR